MEIYPISAVGRGAAGCVTVPVNFLLGLLDGRRDGVQIGRRLGQQAARLAASGETVAPSVLLPPTEKAFKALKGLTTSEQAFEVARRFAFNLFGYSTEGVHRTGIRGLIGRLLSGISGNKLKLVGAALTKFGPWGLALTAVGLVVAVPLVSTGFRNFWESFKKASDIFKGYDAVDVADNPLSHGAHAASLATMGVGTVTAIATLGAAGIPLAVGGLIGTAISGLWIKFQRWKSMSWFEMPNAAPIGLNWLFGMFHNGPRGLKI